MGNGHSTPTCPTVDQSGPPIQHLVGNLTFHRLSVIISGAAAVWSCLIAVTLVFSHATHFSNPPEQKQFVNRQIIRIINIIPFFALVTLLCVWQNGSQQPYIAPALDVGEAFPMAAAFLLMSAYLVPEEGNRESFFNQLEMIDKKGNSTGSGSWKWYKKLSLLVIQWIPVSILLWIAAAASLAAGTYCGTSNKPHFAHIWITLLRMLSTVLCIAAILRFYKRSKSELKPRGSLKQLICFKLIVALNFLQTFIFNFLESGGHLQANKYLSFNDLSHGIPSLMLSCEIAIIAPFFFIAYSPKRYIIRNPSDEARRHQGYAGGPFGFYAILSAINIVDIVTTLLQAIKGRAEGGGFNIAIHNDFRGYSEAPDYGQDIPVDRQGGRKDRRQRY
ncbi:Transmembrane [Hyphodiscus hymeniophilus]|uniref:Transmembrane n=1 Tax=Hyphodiscus hymeniophilus TaxID=353542 RepID=A0A9P6VS18_9HELO|nr:Transmembrane [Hyphodiscus hymeniophilus]